MGRFEELRTRFSDTVSELLRASDGDPRSINRGDLSIQHSSYDVSLPDRKQSQRYSDLYRASPHVSQSIDTYADEVWEAGWYVLADDERTQEFLTEWLTQCSFQAGEVDKGFTDFGRTLVIEHEVKGTALVEIVRDNNNMPVGFKLMDEGEVKVYTLPDQNVLVPPDADPKLGPGHATPSGETPAFVQYDTQIGFEDKEERSFTRDDVIKLARKPGVGDVRGYSRIHSVEKRIMGYLQKLKDNDDAIESKAYPMVHFKLGTEDDPYSKEEKERFIQQYKGENFEPGKLLAVGGDVDIDTFSGEVADIKYALDHDIDHIMTGMPTPKFAIGTHASGVTGSVATVQERQYKKQVRNMRAKVEDNFTPVLKELAEAHSALDDSGVQLKLGRPNGEVPPEDVQGNVIQYQSTVDGDDGAPSQSTPQSRGDQVDPPQQADIARSGSSQKKLGMSNEDPSSTEASAHGPDRRSDDYVTSVTSRTDYFDVDLSKALDQDSEANGVEELADPRLVSTTSSERAIRSIAQSLLVEGRNRASEQLRTQYGDAVTTASSNFAGVAAYALQETMGEFDASAEIRPHVETMVEDTLATFAQDNHTPTFDVDMGTRHESIVRSVTSDIERDIEGLLNEAFEVYHDALRNGAVNGATFEEAISDAESELTRSKLGNRAQLVAQMRASEAINRTKLQEYERHADIVGVEWLARCTPATTSLCRDLGGCVDGDSAIAYFDEGSIGDQFADQTNSDIHPDFMPFSGFPPAHYGCRSSLLPVLDK